MINQRLSAAHFVQVQEEGERPRQRVLQEVEDGHEVGLQIAPTLHDELGVAVTEDPILLYVQHVSTLYQMFYSYFLVSYESETKAYSLTIH